VAEFFIRRPVVAIVLALLFLILGGVAMLRLPIAQFPDIVPPEVLVRATYVGADAQTVEQAVATPLEQQVSGVKGGLYMRSISAADGSMTLRVTFAVGTNLDVDTVLVQNRVSQATSQLPAEVQRLGLTVQQATSSPLFLVALFSPNGTYDRTFLANYAAIHLRDPLLRVAGVGDVFIFGAANYAMRIWLDPQKMATRSITVGDVRAAVNAQNAANPAGRFGGAPAPPGTEFTYTAVAPGRLSSPEQFAAIAVRTLPDGSVVHLGDIARIELGAQTYDQRSRFKGQPAAVIAVYQTPGTNALEAMQGVRAALDRAAAAFPPDMAWQSALDTTLPVREGIREIALTLGIALGLVLIVVFLFLQTGRATFIPMVTVPVSLVGAFLLFPLFGFSINTLSLFALVLAIGLVIDDAIVVVEAVERRIEEGMAPPAATLAAMKLVQGPVVAIALILAAVFLPMGLSGGISGRLQQQFAITIAASVLISAFSALTLSPALSARLLRPRKARRRGGFFARFNRAYGWFSDRYVGLAQRTVRRPWIAILVLALCVGGSYLLLQRTRSGFLPQEDTGYLFVSVTLPPAASLDRTDEALRQLEDALRDTPGVESYTTVAGYSIVAGVTSPFQGSVFVKLLPWEERKTAEARLEGVVAHLNRVIGGTPGVQGLATPPPPIQGVGTTGGVTVFLQDTSGTMTPQALEAAVNRFVAAARERPEVGTVVNTFRASVPQRRVVVDVERVLQRGVDLPSVYDTLSAFLGGEFVNQFGVFGRVWNVYLQAEGAFRTSPDDLRQFYVRDGQGNMVPLSALVTIDEAAGPDFLNRFDLYRAAQVIAVPSAGHGTGDVMAAVEATARETLPREMGFEYADIARQQQEAGSAAGLFGLSLVVVFLILAALYESWSLPVTVLLTTPVAVVGALAGLVARGLEFDVYAQVGLIMLIGLTAKNAILIVEYAQSEMGRGMTPGEAAVEATRERLRPILMTSFAFILGCVPLWVASGAGGGGRRILGTVVVAGMLLSTLVAPLLVPALFRVVERRLVRHPPPPEA
jgi:HAE1 family hydrophobic/amphiphilic exporter-1